MNIKDCNSKFKKKEAIYNLNSRKNYFDSGKIVILNNFLIEEGILAIYHTEDSFCMGAALFDKDNKELLYRTENYILKNELRNTEIKIELKDRELSFSFYNGNEKIKKEIVLIDFILGKECKKNIKIEEKKYKKEIKCVMKKAECNPIISPISNHSWECGGVFNPAIINLNGTIHILYRAVGSDGGSMIGYATSKDGIHIDERLDYPIYKPTEQFELRINGLLQPTFPYCSGGTIDCWGGCEDPRIIKIEDTLYMVYTGYNGIQPPRVAITSIKVQDFLERKWNKWKKPKLLSPENKMNKNWLIFPEKINGKYAILHSITPKIQIEYLDTLNFRKNPNIKSTYIQVKNKGVWDSILRGVGPTPIKIDEGWLVFYHAVSENETHKYKIGAMILDYKNPTKILYKTTFPVIEPDKKYENEGFKGGIVYTCGATIKDGNIFLYYGGADTVVCVASCNLKEFIQQIKENNGKIY